MLNPWVTASEVVVVVSEYGGSADAFLSSVRDALHLIYIENLL